jgi:hypothetical protein
MHPFSQGLPGSMKNVQPLSSLSQRQILQEPDAWIPARLIRDRQINRPSLGGPPSLLNLYPAT